MDNILRLKNEEGSEQVVAYTLNAKGEENEFGRFDTAQEAAAAYKESLEEGVHFIVYSNATDKALTVNEDRSDSPAPNVTPAAPTRTTTPTTPTPPTGGPTA